MFKLVIVEDEDNIRHSLECFIPWEEMGFQVVGTFSDGSDALAYIKDNPCDAVLTDILMSRMSGLEMIRHLHEMHPQIKVVILSGHSEFEFAREAIAYQVVHYLLKPVDEEELMGVFKGLKEQLDSADKAEAAQPSHAQPAVEEDSDYRLLILELDLGSEETLLHILDGIFRNLGNASVEVMQTTFASLYYLVEQNYAKRKINVLNITAGKFHMDNLRRCETVAAIEERVRSDFSYLCRCLKTRKQGSTHAVIARVLEYLDEHCHEDISQEAIAARYRLHPGYFSRLFKQEIGETLSEYLLRMKIQKAAVLLKEGTYKVGEIATKVGYSASSYFSIMFKKYTGCTPREYSQRISL